MGIWDKLFDEVRPWIEPKKQWRPKSTVEVPPRKNETCMDDDTTGLQVYDVPFNGDTTCPS